MAQRDLVHIVNEVVSVPPALRSAAGATNGTSVDLTGYEAATLLVVAGAITDGTHTYKVQDSPDNATWTDVDPSELILPSGISVNAVNAAVDSVAEIGYLGINRYVRAVCTVAGATTGGETGGVFLLGFPRSEPV